MNKKIILVAGIMTLLILVGGYFFIVHKNSQTSTPSINNGSPFGNSGGATNKGNTPPQQPATIIGVGNQIQTIDTLRKITATPVSDAIFLKDSKASTTILQFIERATGNVYEANLTTGAIARKTNTTIPKIENMVWGKPGVSFVGQSISQGGVGSQIFLIGSTTANTTPDGFTPVTQLPLPDNILVLSFSPLADRIFYLLHGFQGAEGYVVNSRGANPTLVWQFPTDEWLSQWIGGETIALTSKASNGISGFLYFLNVKTKTSTVALSNIPGLTTNTSPGGERVFFSSVSGSNWQTNLYTIKTKTSGSLALQTLPEKCVWSVDESALYCGVPRIKSADAPDDWYQGVVSYDDDIWKLDLSYGITSKVVTLNPAPNETIDVENPHISTDGKWLLFMNKKDLSLWAVPIGQ